MKKVHALILQAFIRPFIVTFCIVMFVLLMLFLFKYIDDLIGKGFEWYVILELISYQCAVQLSMALPLSMLLSSIMTFGNLGESYELVAIKAAGVSLRKAMTPLFVLVGLFASGSFFFSDYILPVVNLKMGSLLYDVRKKKADFLIKPGIFNNTIPNYSIRAKSKSKDGTTLYDLTIYNNDNNGNAGSNVLLAKEGYMYFSRDQQYMILKLIDGVRYEDARSSNSNNYDPRQQFTRFYFEETEQKFDMSSFAMNKTDENMFKSHHQMLNLKQLKLKSDSNKIELDSINLITSKEFKHGVLFTSNYYNEGNVGNAKIVPSATIMDYVPVHDRRQIVNAAMSQVQQFKDGTFNRSAEYQAMVEKDIRYDIEYHRKFTLAVSCLLLFAIGAPLGAIIRKGGLGAPVVMSIIFFLIYHIISTVAEKSAREGAITPFWGMWMAIIVLTPLAAFLTYKSTTDSALFDLDQYKIKAQYALNWVKEKLKLQRKKVSS
ncbi:LptF/LptG family permease [Sphingobacterium sp. Mn56C]|uniref:LptF/LptG family permease n=1 Tax=Sphingobacterium sp. Mn56C TaxID=3395261 RepID=UPI003BD235E0